MYISVYAGNWPGHPGWLAYCGPSAQHCFRRPQACTFQLYEGDGLKLRWDNDVRYSAGFRVNEPNALLLNYPNSDDGDRNFSTGLIMNRFDLNSVIDLTGEEFGAQISVQAWYDTVYQRHTDNKSPGSYNPSTPNTQFSAQTVSLNGQHVDLGESFVYGNIDLGIPVTCGIRSNAGTRASGFDPAFGLLRAPPGGPFIATWSRRASVFQPPATAEAVRECVIISHLFHAGTAQKLEVTKMSRQIRR